MSTNRGHGRQAKPEYDGLSYSEISRIQRERRKARFRLVAPVDVSLDSWDKRIVELQQENDKLRTMVEVARLHR